jgi:hypothetical protein
MLLLPLLNYTIALHCCVQQQTAEAAKRLTTARAAHSKATAKLDKLRREAGEKQDTLMRAQHSSSGASHLPLTIAEYGGTGSSGGTSSAAAAADTDTAAAAGNSSSASSSSTAATPAVAALGATIGETTAQVSKL